MLLAILVIIAIWDVSKSAVRNARNGAPSSSPAPARAKSGSSGRSAPRGVRQRQAGYWAREAAGGFPAARTGWHAGWLAHRAALAQQRNIREAARTNHLEAERDTAASIREHRSRQAEALREIEGELAAQQAKGSPAAGKRAVQSAADEVARKRAEKASAATCPSCGAPDGYEHLKGCDPSVPPLPADSVRRAEPAVIDTPVRLHNAEDSSHLSPGDKRCEGCGGTGRNGAGNDACPVCRGWGSGPPDPMSPLAAPDAVCTACGNTGTPGDPVLADTGGNIHLSHAEEQQEAYQDRLGRLRSTPPTTEGTPVADDISAARANPDKHSTHPFVPGPSTNGAAVTADTNYTTVLANAKSFAAFADQDATTAKARHTLAQQHAEEMQAAEVDAATLSSQMDLVEKLKEAEKAAQQIGEHATAVADGLQKRHGGLKEAHDDAPVRAAQREFYEGS